MPSLFESQIYQNIIYTSNKRHSVHVNKNSSIGLKKFLVLCRNNRRHAQQSSDIRQVHQCSLCCVPADISLLHKLKW